MEKIKKLKNTFKRENIDGYIISKNDEFFEENISEFNDRLNFISNFSGSYGFSLILKNKNYLFVDGRYTLQANKQSGNSFKIITFPNKMPSDILKNKKLIIGFDPKLFTKQFLNIFFKSKNCKFKPLKNNLIDQIWKRKTKENISRFYALPERSFGLNHNSKIRKIANLLKKCNADFQFITASENCAWTLNIRGNDSKYVPTPHCYVLIDKNENVQVFCNLEKITSSLKKKFNQINFIDISNVGKILANIKKKKFLIDNKTCSIFLENIILKNNQIINFEDPIYNLKAIKSTNEIKNIKTAHIIDGIALTKYLFWIKKNFLKKKITEIDGSQKLFSFRKKNNKFKSLSFPTISSSGPNGAIIHYKANKKTNRVLKKGDIYLIDSGGQYEFGTTDVTRTLSLDNLNERIKKIFTRVLKGHIAVSGFKIKKGTTGSSIDHHARKFLKQVGLDYAHGTGHGVGYYMNVHEGPQAISKNNKIKFKAGMVVSNEPGYYEKDKFGIRIENLIYVKKAKRRTYFENLTLVPIEKDLIDKTLLNKNEIRWINNYHRKVFVNLKNAMNRVETLELKKACSAI